MTETTKRILQLMEKSGDNPHSLEVKAGLPISSVISWKNGRFKPSADAIEKLSRYFNVSADYLLCLTDEITPIQKNFQGEQSDPFVLADFTELSNDNRFINIVKVYKSLPNEKRERIYSYILSIATGIDLI